MLQQDLFLKKTCNLSYFKYLLSDKDILTVDFKDRKYKEIVFKYISQDIENVQNFQKLSNFMELPLFPDQAENKEVYKLVFEFLLDMQEECI